ncbi:MAG: hypothetical protein WAL91_11050, partial [Propionicimonas sp.]
MSRARQQRPLGLVVAVAGSGVVGLALIGLAVASLASGHGDFSGGVGVALLVYGALILAAAWALWRGSVLGRGPVVATGLLNLIAAISFTATAPWAWAVAIVSAATVVGAALPSTSRALRLSRDAAP